MNAQEQFQRVGDAILATPIDQLFDVAAIRRQYDGMADLPLTWLGLKSED